MTKKLVPYSTKAILLLKKQQTAIAEISKKLNIESGNGSNNYRVAPLQIGQEVKLPDGFVGKIKSVPQDTRRLAEVDVAGSVRRVRCRSIVKTEPAQKTEAPEKQSEAKPLRSFKAGDRVTHKLSGNEFVIAKVDSLFGATADGKSFYPLSEIE